jgi:hypothetical protein
LQAIKILEKQSRDDKSYFSLKSQLRVKGGEEYITYISEVLEGNPEAKIKKFKDWLMNLTQNKSQGIIISGNQGLGKTLTIKLILEQLNYIVRIINPNEIKDHRILDDFYDYYNFVNSIYSKIQFNDMKSKKIVLIFDETENITLTSEKKYIMDIYKENNKNKSFPLIFISNNQHSKLLNEDIEFLTKMKTLFYALMPKRKKTVDDMIKKLEDIFNKGDKSVEDIIDDVPELNDPEVKDKISNIDLNGVKITEPSISDKEFYEKVLKGIGAPVTPQNMLFFYSWRQAE